MKTTTLLFSLCLLLLSCKKDPPKPAAPAKISYYPTEVVRTTSTNSDVTTTRYSYNAANQLVKEEILVNGKLQHFFIYNNSISGVLQKKIRFNELDVPVEQDELERDAAGRIVRLNHSYLDMSGNATFHHYNTFTYNSAGQLAEKSEFTPNDALLKKLTFRISGPDKERVEVYRSNNTLELISETQYDLKQHPLAATGLNTANLPGNAIQYFLTDTSNQDTTTITSAISYNEAGFPLKIVQTYSDGRSLTDTYTYTTR